MKKKIMIIGMIMIMFLTCSMPTISRAADDGEWVSNAFRAAYDFLNEGQTIDEDSITNSLLTFFTNIVRAVNRVLIVLLAALSVVSLAVVGVRYIMSGALPDERRKAQEQMKTVFKGMMYGFGAFMIWNIAMSVVRIILSAMGQSVE